MEKEGREERGEEAIDWPETMAQKEGEDEKEQGERVMDERIDGKGERNQQGSDKKDRKGEQNQKVK